eukprot:640320-Pleurochrysis_carterae.AAC.2
MSQGPCRRRDRWMDQEHCTHALRAGGKCNMRQYSAVANRRQGGAGLEVEELEEQEDDGGGVPHRGGKGGDGGRHVRVLLPKQARRKYEME